MTTARTEPPATDPFRPLPALRGLARLADLRPVVIIDTREQTPLAFTRLDSRRGTLQSGDYSFAGGEETFAVERKSIPDLVACCVGDGRDRFFRELHRLRGFPFARLLIIGTPADIEAHDYRANVTPAAVLATLSAIEARFVPVVFCPTPEEAAQRIERWVYWFAREACTTANTLLRGCEAYAGRGSRALPPIVRPATAKERRAAHVLTPRPIPPNHEKTKEPIRPAPTACQNWRHYRPRCHRQSD